MSECALPTNLLFVHLVSFWNIALIYVVSCVCLCAMYTKNLYYVIGNIYGHYVEDKWLCILPYLIKFL